MATMLTAEQRRHNITQMTTFRFGKKKTGLMEINDGDGQPIVNTIKILSVLYVQAAYSGDATHKEALDYALEEVYDHLGSIGGYMSNGYWESISQGKLRYALMWFTAAMGWVNNLNATQGKQRQLAHAA